MTYTVPYMYSRSEYIILPLHCNERRLYLSVTVASYSLSVPHTHTHTHPPHTHTPPPRTHTNTVVLLSVVQLYISWFS